MVSETYALRAIRYEPWRLICNLATPSGNLPKVNIPREEILAYFCRAYQEEYDALGLAGLDAVLNRGREWDLSSVLKDGGALVFPHVHIADCGHQVAAVVHACLDSGADSVLAIGVLHASSDEMEQARVRVFKGEDQAEGEPLRGIYGPGASNGSDIWRRDHSLYGFRRMLQDEARRRGYTAPKLIERYPFLVGPRPETLPEITELEAIAKDSVVVSTADHCHHGIGYGHAPSEALEPDELGLVHIRKILQHNLALLDAGDYPEFIRHCATVAKSDWRDSGVVLHHLCGPFQSTILDLVPSDFSNSIYQAPAPTWCAGALVQVGPKG